MSELSQDDMEKLASRLAMLASEDGEADNAGRAVGQLARRLGLSGGDLKAMFLAGARLDPAPDTGKLDGLATARELATLRRQVKLLEGTARRVQEERDALAAENGAMRVAQYRRRGTRRIATIVVVVGGVLVGAVVGLLAFYGPDLGPGPRPRADLPRGAAAPATGGIVRSARAQLFREPDRNAPLVATLPPGTRVAVRRLLWNAMTQWAEIEVSGQSGYVSTTEIDLL